MRLSKKNPVRGFRGVFCEVGIVLVVCSGYVGIKQTVTLRGMLAGREPVCTVVFHRKLRRFIRFIDLVSLYLVMFQTLTSVSIQKTTLPTVFILGVQVGATLLVNPL